VLEAFTAPLDSRDAVIKSPPVSASAYDTVTRRSLAASRKECAPTTIPSPMPMKTSTSWSGSSSAADDTVAARKGSKLLRTETLWLNAMAEAGTVDVFRKVSRWVLIVVGTDSTLAMYWPTRAETALVMYDTSRCTWHKAQGMGTTPKGGGLLCNEYAK
jgi:hypothetical protein